MKKNYKKLRGTIAITSLGSGYFSSDQSKEDIYISFQLLNTALNGDEVEVIVYPQIAGDKLRGEVVRIINRKKEKFVGTIERKPKDKFAFVSTDDNKMYVPIFIPNAPEEAKNEIKVLAQIIKWTDPRKNPTGKILTIIGKKGDNDTEMESIVIERGFDVGFPKKVEEEGNLIKKTYNQVLISEIKKRKDFRNTLTFTIDPDDAKDFDDAISFKRLSDNLFEVGVHIADVSYWVKERGLIEKEAIKRGFSVYLVDRTIPMLPEVLSNDICSLNPNEDKLTFSAVFNISKDGIVKNSWFGKTIINSNKRFTYKEAQAVIDGEIKSSYAKELQDLNSVTKKMRKARINNGALEIGHDEVHVEVDQKGNPISISVEKGIDSQKLIEELMILANKEVALFVGGKNSKDLCMYRIHERPDKDSLAELLSFLKKIGYSFNFKSYNLSSKDLNLLLQSISGKDEEFLVKSVLVRSLPKAVYSIDNKGHFAMALKYYAHFTSPIRRYADFLVHRALQKKLERKPTTKSDTVFYKEMSSKLSQREVEAASAERLSVALKQTEYMMNKKGETRNGIISGITEWGIYVQDVETKSEGMIKLKEMRDDYYIFSKENFSIIGSRTKKKYSLGNKVKFKVVGGDVERKILDYTLI